jgi:hypothetical protein
MTIPTPDDEIDRPGYFYPPFREGWNYQGATYGKRIVDGETRPGHSNYATDFNRRTLAGGWLEDTGDPVYAAADGTVTEVDKADGVVLLNHWGGEYRTEYRHMQNIAVRDGEKVKRGDKLGEVGNVAGSGSSFGAHLHHKHLRRNAAGVYEPIKMTFEDKPVAASVYNSETRPVGWDAPGPVNVEGPPKRATWESAAKEAIAALAKTAEKLAAQKAQTELATDERNIARQQLSDATRDLTAARAAEQLAKDAADGLRTELTEANRLLKACQEQPTPACDAAVKAARDADATALEELAQQWRAE